MQARWPFVLLVLHATLTAAAAEPFHKAELVFPLHPKHNHAPGIVECPNGDLLVSWYRGSGERQADDVAVYGARRRQDRRSGATLLSWPTHRVFRTAIQPCSSTGRGVFGCFGPSSSPTPGSRASRLIGLRPITKETARPSGNGRGRCCCSRRISSMKWK